MHEERNMAEEAGKRMTERGETWSVEDLIDHCAAWRPDLAARERDSSRCVSGLVTSVHAKGKEHNLSLVERRWVAIYIRVSTDSQRSSKSDRNVADGYSELHQLRSCIDWCLHHKLAFKVYSDAGVTSAYPPDDAHLIKVLLKAKADRYHKAFTRVWLSDSAKANWTPEQFASMTQYRDTHVEKIKNGPFLEDRETLKPPARRNSRVFHRQALTQVWRDIEARQVHAVVVTDKSRLMRSADLETLFLELAHEHQTKLEGTEESVLTFDISEPEQRGAVYFLATMNEKKLYDSLYNSMKGFAELLQHNKPHSSLPFWLRRDETKSAVVIDENVPTVHRIIELYLADCGEAGAIAARLATENIKLDNGRAVTWQMVQGVLGGDTIQGIQKFFGIDWPTLPRVVDEEIIDDLNATKKRRDDEKEKIAQVCGPQVRAHRTFRSVAFCSCGRPCQHHDDLNIYESTGYLMCHQRKRGPSAEHPGGHAYFPETVLLNWLGEILPFAAHLLDINGPAAARARRRCEARSEIEERIREAESAYDLHHEEALARTLEHAALLGIRKSSPAYEQTVAAMADAIVAEEQRELGILRERLAEISREESADRESARLSVRLDGIDNWSEMDEEQRNGILRAIFDKIVVSPSPLLPVRRKALAEAGAEMSILNQGAITLYLRGVAEPLPEIRAMRGGRSGRAILLESPREWLSTMFGIEQEADVGARVAPEKCRINNGNFTSFFTYLRRYKPESADDPVGRLARAIKVTEGRPLVRLTVQSAVRDYLEARGFEADVLATLEYAWERYLEKERTRLLPKLGARFGVDAANAAWSDYFSAQNRRFNVPQ
jgi:DNA invertase Pin-like site-specific DNA recombinase